VETLSSVCPVVASHNGTIPEVVGNAGVLVDQLNVSRFASKIKEVLLNDELRIKTIKSGLERSQMFNWKKRAGETLMIYKAALNNSKEWNV
jgi:glycosyltransferase involved in cell wall biosynthesis